MSSLDMSQNQIGMSSRFSSQTSSQNYFYRVATLKEPARRARVDHLEAEGIDEEEGGRAEQLIEDPGKGRPRGELARRGGQGRRRLGRQF